MTYTTANIAISGGPSTGKSTLAACLFSQLKLQGYEYDLIFEESRKLRRELDSSIRTDGFDRFYKWRQQEREELRSIATDGFITDAPLFHYVVHAIQHADRSSPRDMLALRELFRMCMELPEDRYAIIGIARDPFETVYKNDENRKLDEDKARRRHEMHLNFVQLFYPSKVVYLSGNLENRAERIIQRLHELKPRSNSS